MKTKVDTSSKLLKIWKKTEKFIPYFIGFKILTFTGFITYMINRQMIYPPPQVIFGLLLLSVAVVLIWDIRYNPFGEDEDSM